MNILRALGLRGGSDKAARAKLRAKLPELYAFVDVAVGGGPIRESLSVNGITPTSLVVRHSDGLEPGRPADFLYTNALGRFRFWATCAKVEGNAAYFDLPTTIKTIETFSARRLAARIPWVIGIQWRYAPDGRGFGQYLPASMIDLSRGGASLVVGRELKTGSQVEVRFMLNSNQKPFVELCEVMRATIIGTSGKHGAGIRFVKIDPQDERTLIDILAERQTLRRNRGVV